MDDSTHDARGRSTAALAAIANEVERERAERGHTPFDDQGVGDGEDAQELPGAEDLPVDHEQALHDREVHTAPADERPLQDRIH